ncbi:hypothetical protein AM202_03095 [Actinobacillus minor 202]|uniref:Malate dehydrogenase n=1 Tax=Actinobacillus minor 202 TaxID=591023 RepID=A0ABP2GVZ2_9PAST|nr:hypothetical protein [Actinobacillus minor]EEV25173.1 hypothetical protein AM202_03095 [Actinobacillus minor 202]
MNKLEAINKIEKLIQRAIPLKSLKRFSKDFNKWKRDASVTLGYIFGENSKQQREFNRIPYSPHIVTSFTTDDVYQNRYIDGIKTAITILESMISEISEFWDNNSNSECIYPANAIENIKLIINHFHQVARQLRSRYSDRNTLEIEDEYDVQDLFHSLLKLYFDDVRAEEWTPSYAGGASRTDFLLKNENIVIEIKKTRRSLKAKELGEQLIVDAVRYQSHPDCDTLICFVYDPEGIIGNPKGIENDLTREFDGVPVYTYIRPDY